MFDLLNPLYFYIGGAIGVLVPLVLHLIHRSRTARLPFSTIRFLKLAQKRSSSRIKMENILLWLLRTVLLVALALAFAMPMLRDRALGQWFGRSPRDVAVVIDGSYSMAYSLGNTTVWENTLDAAAALVDGLSEQDRFCVFVARDRVEPLIEQLSGDKPEALERLRALAFSQTSSRLAPAVAAANEALRESDTRREREIHIITDGQSLPWEGFGAGGGSTDTNADAVAAGVWDPAKVDQGTVCFVTLLGAAAPENVAPLDVQLEPPLIVRESLARATVSLGYTGPPRAATAALYVDGAESAVRAVALGMDDGNEVAFALPPLGEGRHAARVEVPEDNLALDNAFYFIVKVSRHLPVLCVGSEEDTFFLRAALKAGAGAGAETGIEADWMPPAGLAGQKLARYTCVFLCNALPLGAAEVAALEDYVAGGGLLVLFPGDRASLRDYGAWSCMPGSGAIQESVPLASRKRALHWEAPEHAILAPLELGGSTVQVAVKTMLGWESLEPDARRLVTQGGQTPFLAGRPFGSGYVLVFAVSADRAWSDFPLSPFYLPLIHQVVAFGAGVGEISHYIWCTESLPAERYIDDVTADSSLVGPGDENIPLRRAMVEGREALRAEGLMRAGIYGLRHSGASDAVPALAVNMPREESNLATIEEEQIEDAVGLKKISIVRDREELLARVRESRVGRTFGEQVLWLALALAAMEFFYANRLLKEEPVRIDEGAGAPEGGLSENS